MIFTLLNTFFPAFCQHCGKEGEPASPTGGWLCERCNYTLAPRLYTNCPQCNRGNEEGRLAPACKGHTGLTRFFASYTFSSPVAQSLIHSYKFRHASTLHTSISNLILTWILGHDLEHVFAKNNLLVTSVPLSKKRRQTRGFNQAELLAKDIASRLALPYENTLVRIKDTNPQTKVAGSENRYENIKGAFAHGGIAPKGKKILLIDDVYTTGATMRECATTLRQAGASQVWGLAFAK